MNDYSVDRAKTGSGWANNSSDPAHNDRDATNSLSRWSMPASTPRPLPPTRADRLPTWSDRIRGMTRHSSSEHRLLLISAPAKAS
jgi:hypothetical protein